LELVSKSGYPSDLSMLHTVTLVKAASTAALPVPADKLAQNLNSATIAANDDPSEANLANQSDPAKSKGLPGVRFAKDQMTNLDVLAAS
jgi:hypothetical protein